MSSTNLTNPSNKRVLSELSPSQINQNTVSKKQKGPVDLKMTNMPSQKFQSKIPAPIHKTTSVSTPVQQSKPSITTSNPNFPKDYQTAVLSIKDRLARKSSVNDPTTFRKPKQPPQPRRSTSGDIQERYYALNDECKNFSIEVDHLTRELSDIKRKCKVYQYKVDEARDEVQLMRDRFQFTEESVVKKVADEEKLMFLKSQESQIKLDNNYKEIEFEMKNQLEEAKSFDKQGLIDKIEELKQTENKLISELENMKEDKEKLIDLERETIEQKLQDKLISLREDQEKSALEVETANEKKKELLDKLNSSKSNLEQQQKNLQNLKQEISDVETSMSNFLLEKESLVSQLSSVEKDLQEVQEQDKKGQAEYDTIQSQYLQASTKMNKHDTHRRILENSIMDYEGKFRVYVMEDTNIQTHGKHYQFNKQFPKNTPTSVITDEFSCLLKSSLRGSNVSIINTAYTIPTFELVISIHKHISEQSKSIKNRQFTINYQCLCIINSQMFDNINRKTSVSEVKVPFQSKKIQIEDQNQFIDIVENMQINEQELVVHLFLVGTGVSGQYYETTVMVVDFANTRRVDQMELLREFKSKTGGSPITEILSFARNNSKCLFLGNVTSDDFEYLNELQSLNSMNSLYKPK